jgi:hypothetical protein
MPEHSIHPADAFGLEVVLEPNQWFVFHDPHAYVSVNIESGKIRVRVRHREGLAIINEGYRQVLCTAVPAEARGKR